MLAQLELFKNGGPILESGNAWQDDLGTQMKNSIHFEDSHRDGYHRSDRDHRGRREERDYYE